MSKMSAIQTMKITVTAVDPAGSPPDAATALSARSFMR